MAFLLGFAAIFASSATAAPPANDAFADRIELTGPTAVADGTDVDATTEPGEPDLGSRSIWWTWTAPADGEAWIDTCGSDFDHEVAVFTGSSVAELDLLATGYHDGQCESDPAVSFQALAGVSYRIAVYAGGSQEGAVRLRINAPPINDDFSDALDLDPLESSAFRWGSTRGATAEPGEPQHAGAPGGASVWYRWTAATTGVVRASVCDRSWPGGGDTMIGVYTGAGVAGLTELAGNDDSADCFGAAGGSSVSFLATAGQVYHLAVDAKDGQTVDFELSVTPPPVNDAFDSAEPFEDFSFGRLDQATAEPGEPDHSGLPAARSLWYRWTPAQDGPVELELCTYGSFAPRLAIYTGDSLGGLIPAAEGSPGGCGGQGGGFVASLEAHAGSEYLIAVDGEPDASGDFELSRAGPPPNDDLAGAAELDDSGRFGRNTLATTEAGEPEHAGAAGGGSLWYAWTAPATGEFVLEACGPLDTLLAVYRGDSIGSLDPVAGNDDAAACGRAASSQVTFEASAGERYLIAVDGKAGARGEFTLTFQSRPYNDMLAESAPIGPGRWEGSTLLATKEPGEPDHAGDPGGHSVWFHSVPAQSGTVTLSTCEADFDTLLTVYRRDSGDDFTSLEDVGSSDDAPGCGPAATGSRVTVQAEAGSEYVVAIDGKGGSSGTFELDVQVAPPNDSFEAATVVQVAAPGGASASGDLRGATRQAGEPEHVGSSSGGSLWYRWSAPVSGAYSVDTCASAAADTVLGVYEGATLEALSEVAASDDSSACGSGSPASRVTFEAVAGRVYRIAVAGGNASAGFFRLWVARRPANDDLVQAATINTRAFIAGSTRAATGEPGEPDHAGVSGGASVWYRWVAPRTGQVTARTCDGFFFDTPDTLLAVYTGTSYATLVPVVSNDDTLGCAGGRGSVATFTATAGTEYRIAVDGKGGQAGDYVLSLVDQPANDDIEDAMQVTPELSRFLSADNRGASKQPGEPDHAGDTGGHSVWYRFSAQLSGEYWLTNCHPGALLAVYTGSAAGALTERGNRTPGACGAGGERISFEATAGTEYLIAVDGRGGAEGTFSLGFDLPPPNDRQTDAVTLQGASDARRGTNVRATKEPDEGDHGADPGGRSSWYRWVAPSSGSATVDVCEADFDTLLGVYRGDGAGAPSDVAGSDDSADCRPQTGSRVSFEATGGVEYLIAVDGKGGAAGTFKVAVNPPANDRFSRAVELVGDSDSADGTAVASTREPDEPVHDAFGSQGGSVWYRWTANRDSPAHVELCIESGADQALAVYSGSSVGALSSEAVATEEPRSCERGRRAEFLAQEGETYRIAAGERFDGSHASFRVVLNGQSHDAFATPRVLRGTTDSDSGSTTGASKEPEEPDHAGDAGGHSVWYRWVAPSGPPGEVTIDTCGSALDTLLAVYRGTELTEVSSVGASDDSGACGAGATASSVTFTYEPDADYRIAIDGRGGAAGGYEVHLAAVAPPPVNDDFDAARLIDQETAVLVDDTSRATKETGEPDHAGQPGGASLWYRWTAVAGGPVAIDTCGSGIDTLLGVYTGTSLATVAEVASADDGGGCGAGASRVTFEAVAGVTYHIAVDGKNAQSGQVALRVNRPLNDDFSDAITIDAPFAGVAGSTSGATAQPGEPSATAPASHSVWYRWTAPSSGPVHLHTCSAIGRPMDVRVYTGETVGSLSAVDERGLPADGGFAGRGGCEELGLSQSLSASVFTATAGTTYMIAVDAPLDPHIWGLRTGAGPFVLYVDAPRNDLRLGAQPVVGAETSVTATNLGASKEAGERDHAGDAGGASVWFTWFAGGTGPATISTCGSAVDTLLSVELPDGTAVASNDDSDACGAGAIGSSVTFDVSEGDRYRIALDGKRGATGALQLDVAGPPDTTAPETNTPAFPAVVASSTAPYSIIPDELGSEFECSVDDEPFEPCELVGEIFGFLEGRIRGLAGGLHTLALREIDAVGNADPTPATASFEVDLTAPETTITSGPDGPTRDAPVSFRFASSEEGGFFVCTLDGGQPEACYGGEMAYPGLSEGDHSFSVSAYDRAGHQDLTPAVRDFVVDRTAPAVNIASGPTVSVNTTTADFTLESDDAATEFRCRLQPVDAGFASCDAALRYSELAEGSYTLAVFGVDRAGNESATVTRSFTVDVTAPRTTFNEAPGDATNDATPRFAFGAGEVVSGFRCSLDGGDPEPCASPVETGPLADGPHVFEVEARDLAGNVETPPVRREFTVDTVEPETTIVAGPGGPTNVAGPFSFSSDEDTAGFECAVDEGPYGPCPADHTLSGIADGEHMLSVRAVDRASNADTTPAQQGFLLDTVAPSVEITEPPPAVTGRDVAVAFAAGEAGAAAGCRLDGGSFEPCESPVSYSELAEGPHSFEVRATDAAGNVGDVAMAEFVVDTGGPTTTITNGPEGHTNAASAEFSFAGTDAARFECALDDGSFGDCASPARYEGLADGPHRFRVRAVDAAGNADASPAQRDFTVDTQAPDTAVTGGPEAPVHARAVAFGWQSSEPPGAFECAFDSESFASCPEPGEPLTHGLGGGEHLFRVRALDAAGNVDPTPAEWSFTVANAVPEAFLDLSSPDGPAPHPVDLTPSATDADGDELSFVLQWGDGETTEGTLPHAALRHTYDEPGVYVVRLEVDDGFDPKVMTRSVTVSLAEPLHADAGDDLTAVAGRPIRLDGGGSRPLHGISGYEWDFGDGAAGSGRLVQHTYGEPGEYEARLTVGAGGDTDSDTATVKVVPPEAAGGVSVTVRSGGLALEGADVLLVLPEGDARYSRATSDAGGTAHLAGVPDGQHKVYAFKPGYVPAVGNLSVNGGMGTGEVELAQGEAAAATVESRRLSLDEVVAAGIDPDDPANQHVFEFEVEVGTDSFAGHVGNGGFIGGGGSSTSCTRERCVTRSGDHLAVTDVTYVGDAPILSTLVMPARATFLKEFYEVSLVVSNLAPAAFTLAGGRAAITLPTGLSLAPTSQPQASTLDVPDISGGESVTTDWIVRGDSEGEYHVAASYAGVLDPFGHTVRIEGRTVDPIKVWGAGALELVVEVDDGLRDKYPFAAWVGLRNVADIPVYNAAVELRREGRHGYVVQPRQQTRFQTREIAPGDTFWAGPFVLVPDGTGAIDLAESFVRQTAGDARLDSTIVTRPRSPSFEDTPTLEGVRRNTTGGRIALRWEAIPNASEYLVFRAPDRDSDFPSEPIGRTSETSVVVPGETDEGSVIAISALVDGELRMHHPLLAEEGLDTQIRPLVELTDITRCGDRHARVLVDMSDEDVELESWSWRRGQGDENTKQIGGHYARQTITFDRADPSAVEEVSVRLENADGEPYTAGVQVGACSYVALGDSYSSGEGALEYDDDTDYDDDGVGKSKCHRSAKAYGPVLDEMRADVVMSSFVACSGAVIDDVTEPKPPGEDGPREELPAQIDAVRSSTDLVTITMGGNDAFFDDVLLHCVAVGRICKALWADAVDRALATAPGRLQLLYEQIRAAAAEHARVVVLGYPPIFAEDTALPCLRSMILDSDARWMRNREYIFNERIKEAAADAGVEYVDLWKEFKGHEICGEDEDWMNAVVPLNKEHSFHPNEAGQQAMAEAVNEHLSKPPEFERVLQPGETALRPYFVAADTDSLVATARWPGSDVALELISPSGREITRATTAPDVTRDTTPTSETVTVDNPESGEWGLRVRALDVAPEGEPVTIDVLAVPDIPQPPIALAEVDRAQGMAPATIHFDATHSSSPRPGPLEASWDFGDGATATGMSVDHEYATAGTYTATLTVTDAGGVEDTDVIVMEVMEAPDTAAPDTELTLGPTGAINDSTPTFEFTASEAGTTFRCRIDTAPFEDCESPYTTAPLGDGAHTFTVAASDTAGNTDATPATRAFTVDTQPPSTEITSGPNGPTSDTTPTFAFRSTDPAATYECRVDGAAFAACGSPFTTSEMADGSHTFAVRASDAAGNTDPTPASRAFSVSRAGSGGGPGDGSGGTGQPVSPPADVDSSFSFAGRVRLKGWRVVLTLEVPGPGLVGAEEVRKRGRSASHAGARRKRAKPLLRSARVTAAQAGRVSVTIKTTAAGRRLLRAGRRLVTRVRVIFTPSTGAPSSSVKRVAVKRPRTRRAGR